MSYVCYSHLFPRCVVLHYLYSLGRNNNTICSVCVCGGGGGCWWYRAVFIVHLIYGCIKNHQAASGLVVVGWAALLLLYTQPQFVHPHDLP